MRILIAEDETVSRRVLKMTLESWGHEVIEARDGAVALQILQNDSPPKLAILDLSMPEMDGIKVCKQVRQNSSATPTYIILLTANTRKELIVTGLEAGADDYVTKPFDTDELHARVKVGMRMVDLQMSLAQRVAELELAQESLRNLSLTDDLTGLYNRRGFFALAKQQLSSARREGRHASLVYIDMDGLKRLNDTHGHEIGSRVIQEVGDILRETFRSSDLIARIGGDEFVVFETSNDQIDEGTDVQRLQDNVTRHNAQQARDYEISLSIGVASMDSDSSMTLEELLKNGDKTMYQQKRNKRR
ncbi:MAG TPA: diguanylate cyclase [Pyrinomonadaceae bacterium]